MDGFIVMGQEGGGGGGLA